MRCGWGRGFAAGAAGKDPPGGRGGPPRGGPLEAAVSHTKPATLTGDGEAPPCFEAGRFRPQHRTERTRAIIEAGNTQDSNIRKSGFCTIQDDTQVARIGLWVSAARRFTFAVVALGREGICILIDEVDLAFRKFSGQRDREGDHLNVSHTEVWFLARIERPGAGQGRSDGERVVGGPG